MYKTLMVVLLLAGALLAAAPQARIYLVIDTAAAPVDSVVAAATAAIAPAKFDFRVSNAAAHKLSIGFTADSLGDTLRLSELRTRQGVVMFWSVDSGGGL